MPFVSYAQNLEDVNLWRALSDITDGFYVDVGAWHPTDDSVTRAFYDMGWHGINIEPNPAYHAMLAADRPRDMNLPLAIGDEPGTATMNVISETGLTSLDPALVARHEAEGRQSTPVEVRIETLARVLAQHAPPGQPIHFLKIDVEGFEYKALCGMDFSAHRPWVVVVEATEPGQPTPNHHGWEPVLLGNGYRFCYFDGLNRFYVCDEHAELAGRLAIPPNVFDDFETARQRDEVARLRSRISAIENSRSWKITAPLRWLSCRLGG